MLTKRRRFSRIASALLASYALLRGGVPVQAACDAPFVKSVLTRNGGIETLAKVKTLRWRGTAVIHGDRGDIAISVDTSVTPFVTARSASWLRSEDASNARLMLVEKDRGWLEREGKRSPMPTAMFEHEWAQFAIYGLMLLAPMCDEETHVTEDSAARSVSVRHPNAPATTLYFDAGGRLIRARNTVPAPDGNGFVDQEFMFSTERVPGPISWPRTMHIEQNGKAYFDLTFDQFEAAMND